MFLPAWRRPNTQTYVFCFDGTNNGTTTPYFNLNGVLLQGLVQEKNLDVIHMRAYTSHFAAMTADLDHFT